MVILTRWFVVGVSPSGKASGFDPDIEGSIPSTPTNLKGYLMIFFNEFMEQYYFYISIGIFIVVYTALLVCEIVQRQSISFEDCALGFIVVAFISVIWFIVIPIAIAVFLVYLYVLLVKKITKLYIRRSKA